MPRAIWETRTIGCITDKATYRGMGGARFKFAFRPFQIAPVGRPLPYNSRHDFRDNNSTQTARGSSSEIGGTKRQGTRNKARRVYGRGGWVRAESSKVFAYPNEMTQPQDQLGSKELGGHVALRLAGRQGDFRAAIRLAATTGIVMAQSNAWLAFVQEVAERLSGSAEPTPATKFLSAVTFTLVGTACVWSLQYL